MLCYSLSTFSCPISLITDCPSLWHFPELQLSLDVLFQLPELLFLLKHLHEHAEQMLYYVMQGKRTDRDERGCAKSNRDAKGLHSKFKKIPQQNWSLLSVSESFPLDCFHLPLCCALSNIDFNELLSTWDPTNHLLIWAFIAYLVHQQLCPETILWSMSLRLEIIICCVLREAHTSAVVIPSPSNDISISCSKENSLSLPVILMKMPIFILLNSFTERDRKIVLTQK